MLSPARLAAWRQKSGGNAAGKMRENLFSRPAAGPVPGRGPRRAALDENLERAGGAAGQAGGSGAVEAHSRGGQAAQGPPPGASQLPSRVPSATRGSSARTAAK